MHAHMLELFILLKEDDFVWMNWKPCMQYLLIEKVYVFSIKGKAFLA